jgi:adenine-specific DNA-methyltransferase
MADNSPKKGRYTKHSNKIGLYSNSKGSFVKNDTEVVLNFPFKDAVLEGGMSKEDVGREERFFHIELDSKDIDTLEEPKVLTDFRYVNKDDEKPLTADSNVEFFDEDGNLKQNLLIKGNNLLALYTLRERLAGQVKLIYIDPPYNTKGDANSFAYNNTFNHSSWLAFMKNRLEVSKGLLKDDGFIAITIDHSELLYLGVLADEVFGRENRVGIVTIVHKPEGRNQEKFFGTSNEFMLVYAKNKEAANFNSVVLDPELAKKYNLTDDIGNYRLQNFIRLTDGQLALRNVRPKFWYPIYVNPETLEVSASRIDEYQEVYPITTAGVEMSWKALPDTLGKGISDGNIVAEKDSNGRITVLEKIREGQVIKTHWVRKEYNAIQYGTKVLNEIFGEQVFGFPKSVYAVEDTLKLMTSGQDIVLDFFSGSGTTGHATLMLNSEDGGNRKFILVEQMDYIESVTKERLSRVIKSNYANDSFVFLALKKYNQEYVDLIANANSLSELEDIYVDMRNNAFLKFWFDRKEFEKDENFRNLDIDKRKQKLIDVLDENQLYLNYADMNDARHKVTADEKTLTDKFYGTAEN